ncbi:MAG: aspartate aminotransferase family protein [Candidatus Lokiarchaeota archaeon]|nr:aspartate aminotransferase family protein [Candidatus Lokiarchaeota archaeon]
MTNEWIERGTKVIMNTYSQFPIVLEKGDGVYLWDTDGKKYLDFVAGIAVNALGYNDIDYVKEISTQLTKLQHCSNLYWMPPSIELSEILIQNSCFDKVFYCNSGAEAVEAAIKLSKKYGKKFHGENCYEIITMKKSFHGRTLATVSATGQTKYQKGYSPLLAGFSYVEFNNFNELEKAVSENTCAIIIEPIQGEGGIHPAEKTYLEKVRSLCDKNDIVLIFDEVQCGIGRTGELFAYQLFNIEPDVVSLAKGLGGGFPIGAMLATQSKADAFQPGDHASTFGGNPLACTAGKVVLNKLLLEGVLKNVQKQGTYFKSKLIELQERYEIITDVRGYGLMLGIELNRPVKDVVKECMEKGLLILGAGENVIRFVPPLVIGKKEIDIGIGILNLALQQIQE